MCVCECYLNEKEGKRKRKGFKDNCKFVLLFKISFFCSLLLQNETHKHSLNVRLIFVWVLRTSIPTQKCYMIIFYIRHRTNLHSIDHYMIFRSRLNLVHLHVIINKIWIDIIFNTKHVHIIHNKTYSYVYSLPLFIFLVLESP